MAARKAIFEAPGRSREPHETSARVPDCLPYRMNAVVVSPTPSLQPSHGMTLPSSSLEHFEPSDIADSLTVIEGE